MPIKRSIDNTSKLFSFSFACVNVSRYLEHNPKFATRSSAKEVGNCEKTLKFIVNHVVNSVYYRYKHNLKCIETFINPRIHCNTRFRKHSTKNRSNKQSMHVILRKIKYFDFSDEERYSIKRCKEASMHSTKCLASPVDSDICCFEHWNLSSCFFCFFKHKLPNFLYSLALTQATFSTRSMAFNLLNEAIVCSIESCKIRRKVLTRTTAISSLQAHFSSVSNRIKHSGCHKKEKNIISKEIISVRLKDRSSMIYKFVQIAGDLHAFFQLVKKKYLIIFMAKMYKGERTIVITRVMND